MEGSLGAVQAHNQLDYSKLEFEFESEFESASDAKYVKSRANTVEAAQVYTVRVLEPLDSVDILISPVQ